MSAFLSSVRGLLAVVREQAHADAGRDIERLAVDLKRRGQRLQHLLRHAGHIVLGGNVIEQDHELVTPEARHGVAVTHAALEPLGQLLQQAVTHLVTECIVDGLETVQFHEQHPRAPLAPARARQRLFQAIEQQRAVRQLGERVVLRHEGQTLLRLHPLRNVLAGSNEVRDTAIGVLDRRDGFSS